MRTGTSNRKYHTLLLNKRLTTRAKYRQCSDIYVATILGGRKDADRLDISLDLISIEKKTWLRNINKH
jgi:hypothetical protein